jgi:hypothetical protein
MDNVILANFDPQVKLSVYQSIKYLGVKRVEEMLMAQGLHPSFVKAIIRNIMRNIGW